MKPADELRLRAAQGQQPVRPLDPGPLDYLQLRNERAHADWSGRWYFDQLGKRIRRFSRMLRGLPADDPSEIRDCICGDPENCTQPVPGYRCKAGR